MGVRAENLKATKADLRKSNLALAKEKNRTNTQARRFYNAYEKLVQLGLKQTQIDVLFGLGRNLKKLREGDPQWQAAHEDAMLALESKLASHGVIQAIGYDYTEEKTTFQYVPAEISGKKGNWKPLKKEKTIKHQPGNASQFQFVITNLFGDRWKNSKEIVNRIEGYDSSPAERNRNQIATLSADVLAANSSETEGKRLLSDSTARISDAELETSEK